MTAIWFALGSLIQEILLINPVSYTITVTIYVHNARISESLTGPKSMALYTQLPPLPWIVEVAQGPLRMSPRTAF
jgi:hypothetical protein